MAKVQLSQGGYTPISKGEHIFKIIKSTYDEDFGKIEVEMVTQEGQKHTERFSLIKDDGEINEGARNAFSYFAKTALNNFNLDEIDTDDIVGCYMKCIVDHDIQPNRKDPAKTVTFVRLTDKSPASGFEPSGNASSSPTSSAPSGKGSLDLDALLG